jgi:hypothetical protein
LGKGVAVVEEEVAIVAEEGRGYRRGEGKEGGRKREERRVERLKDLKSSGEFRDLIYLIKNAPVAAKRETDVAS